MRSWVRNVPNARRRKSSSIARRPFPVARRRRRTAKSGSPVSDSPPAPVAAPDSLPAARRAARKAARGLRAPDAISGTAARATRLANVGVLLQRWREKRTFAAVAMAAAMRKKRVFANGAANASNRL
jgi:hypothetical protein